MSSRVDAVSQRVQTAVTTKKVTQSMASVVNSMEAAMRSMNLEQVRQYLNFFMHWIHFKIYINS
jgi:charged multivesicular body protein 1